MSKFIIGNKPINSISGPVRVCVLKPDDDLKKRFEEEGSRLPYIILFGDHHFKRENNCEDCNKENLCYEVDDPEFLKLFDGVATKNYPVDFYIEQEYEPRLSDPNIYDINPILETSDKEGYLSKFIRDYKICYSKTEKETRTERYKKECPTRDIRWHYIDIRNFTYGNSGEAKLNKGIYVYYNMLKLFFEEPESQTKLYNMYEKYIYELTMTFDIINNGLHFLETYVTIDSNFLLGKQIKKQAIKELRNPHLWYSIIKDNIRKNYKTYISISDEPFDTKDYLNIVRFYLDVLTLISDKDIPDFLVKRKELIDTVKGYNIFENNQANLINMISFTTKIAMMDIYTIARMIKKPNGTPGFISMYYGGDTHVQNIRDILVRYFSYKIVGESYSEKERCQIVKNIDFNILKAKREYK